jgi:hypothetical protein
LKDKSQPPAVFLLREVFFKGEQLKDAYHQDTKHALKSFSLAVLRDLCLSTASRCFLDLPD